MKNGKMGAPLVRAVMPAAARAALSSFAQQKGARSAGRRRCLQMYSTREQGQGTMEYMVVVVAFLAMICALGALFRAFAEGTVVQDSVSAASHTTAQGVLGDLQDILLY